MDTSLPVPNKLPYPLETNDGRQLSSTNDSSSSFFFSLPEELVNKILDFLPPKQQDWCTMTVVSNQMASLLEFKWRQYTGNCGMNCDWFGLDQHAYPEKMRYLYFKYLDRSVFYEIESRMQPMDSNASKPTIFDEERLLNHPQAGNQLLTGLKNLLDIHKSLLGKISVQPLSINRTEIDQLYKEAFQKLENAIQGQATIASGYASGISDAMLSGKIPLIMQQIPDLLPEIISKPLYQLAEKSAKCGNVKGLEFFLGLPFSRFIDSNELNLNHIPNLLFAITHRGGKEMQKEWIVKLATYPLQIINPVSLELLCRALRIAIELQKWQEANYFLDNLIIHIRTSTYHYLLQNGLDQKEIFKDVNFFYDKNAYIGNLPARVCYLMAILTMEKLRALAQSIKKGKVANLVNLNRSPLGFIVNRRDIPASFSAHAQEVIKLLEIATEAFGKAVPAEIWVHKAEIHFTYYTDFSSFFPSSIGGSPNKTADLIHSLQYIRLAIAAYGKNPSIWSLSILWEIIYLIISKTEVLESLEKEIKDTVLFDEISTLLNNVEEANQEEENQEVSFGISKLKQMISCIRKIILNNQEISLSKKYLSLSKQAISSSKQFSSSKEYETLVLKQIALLEEANSLLQQFALSEEQIPPAEKNI